MSREDLIRAIDETLVQHTTRHASVMSDEELTLVLNACAPLDPRITELSYPIYANEARKRGLDLPGDA